MSKRIGPHVQSSSLVQDVGPSDQVPMSLARSSFYLAAGLNSTDHRLA